VTSLENLNKKLEELGYWNRWESQWTYPLYWNPRNHFMFGKSTRRIVETLLMLSLIHNGKPRHPKGQFWKLPKNSICYDILVRVLPPKVAI